MEKRVLHISLILIALLCFKNSVLGSSVVAIGNESSEGQNAAKRKFAEIYEPICPLLKKIKTEKEIGGTDNVMDIAGYLVKRDLSHQSVTLHKPLDPAKLQEFLYKAQGYHLAVYGEKLFSADVKQGKYTPMVSEVYTTFKGKKAISEEEAAVFNGDENKLSATQKQHVECIERLCSDTNSFKGLSLVENGKDDVISEEKLKKTFRNSALWPAYIVERLALASSDAELCNLIHYAREYLSYGCLKKDDIYKIHTYFKHSREQFEGTLTSYWKSIRHYRWPHQAQDAPFEAFMSYLFFPVQFENLYQGTSGSIQQDPLQYLLAISASYGNPLALYHVAEILEMYNPLENDDDEEDIVEKHFSEEGIALIDRYACEESVTESVPHYYCALLCFTRIDVMSAHAHFKKGYERGELWSTYRHACNLVREGTEKEAIKEALDKLSKMNPGLARIAQEDLYNNREERIKNYIAAGELGVPEGYLSAAMLYSGKGDEENALKFYLLAVRNNIVSYYSEVGEIFLKKGKFEEACEVYRQKGKAGRLGGFNKLVKLLLRNKKENKEKILKYSKKSAMGGCYMDILNVDYDKGIEFEAMSEQFRENEVKELKEIVANAKN